MTLSEFCARVVPILARGASANDATSGLLFGRPSSVSGPSSSSVSRLSRRPKFDGVEPVFLLLRQSVMDRLGEARWSELLDGYSRRYPIRSIERSENGVWLASYLREGGAGPHAPAWLAELADFEWWEWRTSIAPDSPLDRAADSGPLRLASTVALRAYSHDLIGWLEVERPKRRREPATRTTTVVFWRDAEKAARRANASPEELAVLKCAHGGFPLRAPGLSKEAMSALVERLRRDRILLGRPQRRPAARRRRVRPA